MEAILNGLLRDFDREQSLAGLSIGIAVYVLMGAPVIGMMLVLVVFSATGIDWDHAIPAVACFGALFWVALNALAVRAVMRWPQPRKKTYHFLAFQIVAGTIMLAATAGGPPPPGTTAEVGATALRWLFDALLLSGSVTYGLVSVAARTPPESAYYGGLLYTLAVVLFPFFR